MNQDTKKMLVKSGITAVTNALVGSWYFGVGNVSMLGQELPIYIPLAVSGAISSAGTDFLHAQVLNMIPLNENYSNIESIIVGMGLSGILNVGVLAGTLDRVPKTNYLPIAAIGAGAYVTGDYGANRLLDNDEGQLIF